MTIMPWPTVLDFWEFSTISFVHSRSGFGLIDENECNPQCLTITMTESCRNWHILGALQRLLELRVSQLLHAPLGVNCRRFIFLCSLKWGYYGSWHSYNPWFSYISPWSSIFCRFKTFGFVYQRHNNTFIAYIIWQIVWKHWVFFFSVMFADKNFTTGSTPNIWFCFL